MMRLERFELEWNVVLFTSLWQQHEMNNCKIWYVFLDAFIEHETHSRSHFFWPLNDVIRLKLCAQKIFAWLSNGIQVWTFSNKWFVNKIQNSKIRIARRLTHRIIYIKMIWWQFTRRVNFSHSHLAFILVCCCCFSLYCCYYYYWNFKKRPR